ncbi:hypothetical protein BpHYR1_006645 [Brachionus plicatilis]|uniref:Uncharacterized protein n=1 Tax=Brachionus plicatilis TaxID=10195 RepID=A0A3M7P2F9_BRAPC|nr:hypothetical protein BpHYR1_006645 [Brachionus plicatilis]
MDALVPQFEKLHLDLILSLIDNHNFYYRKPLRIGAAVNTKPYNYRNAANPNFSRLRQDPVDFNLKVSKQPHAGRSNFVIQCSQD